MGVNPAVARSIDSSLTFATEAITHTKSFCLQWVSLKGLYYMWAEIFAVMRGGGWLCSVQSSRAKSSCWSGSGSV